MEEKIKKHAWHPVYLAVWYRVILDEAHTIKNRVTKGSYIASVPVSDYGQLLMRPGSFTCSPAPSEKAWLGHQRDTSQQRSRWYVKQGVWPENLSNSV